MDELLQILIDLAAASTAEAGAARTAEIRARLDQALADPDTPLDLAALETGAVSAFDDIHQAGDWSPEAVTRMGGIADAIDAIRSAQDDAAAAASEREAAVAALAARISGQAEADPPAEDTPDGDPANADDGAPEGGADPDTTADGDGGGDAGETAPAGTPSPAGAPASPALVAGARGRRGTTVPLSQLPNRRPRNRNTAGAFRWEAAADVHGFAAGSQIRDGRLLAQAVVNRLGSLGRAGTTGMMTAGVAAIRRDTGRDEFTVNDLDVSDTLLDRLTDENRLPGGSLTAAGGWCAPSEILYDLCEGAGMDGGVDLPTITTRRGGVRWPASPLFSTLYADANTTFRQTEAVVIAGATPKPCYEIPCTTFNEVRLDVTGVCVKSPILTERGYPELVRRTIDEIMAVHFHKVNASKIAAMVTASTAVTFAEADPLTAGYTASLLMAVEMQVQYLRYRNRWAPGTTLELIGPLWARPTMRADLAARNGVPLENVSDATLDAYLRTRGVNPQWVYDWQDAFASGVATDFGGTTPPKLYPANVDFLIYRAGTFFLAQNDVITVDGLYDSALLAANMHLALFTEEGIAVAKRCWDSLRLRVPVCPGGASGGAVLVDCTP